MTNLIKPALLLSLCCTAAQAQVIIADNYDAGSPGTTGFGASSGVNASLATRLSGSLKDSGVNLKYVYTQPKTGSYKAETSYSITGNALRVEATANSGRFTLSGGTTPYDFGSVLAGTVTAPVVYDVAISMKDDLRRTARFSFGLATEEDNVTFWDFGVQVYLSNPTATDGTSKNQVQRRIDTGSCGVPDINAPAVADAGARNSWVNLTMRVTDAGAETAEGAYSSRVQLYWDTTLIYDTSTAADLPNGWRFDGPARYFIWDQADTDVVTTRAVFYDKFTVTKIGIAPAAPAKTLTRVPGGSAKIAISELLASGISLVNVGTSANATITKDDEYIYYQPNAGFNASETFIYTVSNGTLENVGRIKVNVLNPGGTAQSIDYSSGSVSIRFAAIPGLQYDVQRATAVQPAEGDWSLVQTITIPENGIYSFTDPSPPEGQAFYRLKQH